MGIGYEDYKRIRQEAEAIANENRAKLQADHNNRASMKPNEYKVWTDTFGNVNKSNLTTGETERTYQSWGAKQKPSSKDSVADDLNQAITGAITRQGANYRSALGTLGLGIAGLVHGDNNYQPEVGSTLWKLIEGGEAGTKAANAYMEDSKKGRGAIGSFAMDLTTGAVDLIGDQVMNLVVPGSGFAAMGVRSFGGGAEDSRQQGKSISTQFLKGLKSAAVEVATEKMWQVGGVGAGGEGFAQGLIDQGFARVAKRGGNVFLTKLMTAFGTEAVEEMASDLLNPLADRVIAGIVRGDYDVEEMASIPEILYDGLIGGALGLLGGTSEGIQAQQQLRSMGAEGYGAFLDNQMADRRQAAQDKRTIGNVKKAVAWGVFKDGVQKTIDKLVPNRADTASPETLQNAATEPLTPDQQSTPEAAPLTPDAASPEFNSNVETEQEETRPDDDSEPIEALEEVSRWGQTEQAPVEDLTDALSEGENAEEKAPTEKKRRKSPSKLSRKELSAEYEAAINAGDEKRAGAIFRHAVNKGWAYDLMTQEEIGEPEPQTYDEWANEARDYDAYEQGLDNLGIIDPVTRGVDSEKAVLLNRFLASEPAIEDTTDALKEGQNIEEIEALSKPEKENGIEEKKTEKKPRKKRSKKKTAETGADTLAEIAAKNEQEQADKKAEAQTKKKSGAEILAEAANRVRSRRAVESLKTAAEPKADSFFDEEPIASDLYDTAKNVDGASFEERVQNIKEAVLKEFGLHLILDAQTGRSDLDTKRYAYEAEANKALDRFVDSWLNRFSKKTGRPVDPARMRQTNLEYITRPTASGWSRIESFLRDYLEKSESGYEIGRENSDIGKKAERVSIEKQRGESVDSSADNAEDMSEEHKEQMAEEGRQNRLAHRLTSGMTVEEIADAIRSFLDPKKINQSITVRAKDAVKGPYSLNAFVPAETTQQPDGTKTTAPREGAPYTFRLFHSDAKTGTKVLVLKGKADNIDSLARRTANIISEYENGKLSGKEAVMKITRGEIVKRLNEQREKLHSDENVLAKDAAPDYTGEYKIGDFTAKIEKATAKEKGRTYIRGYSLSVEHNGKTVIEPHTVSIKSNPIQALATDIESANFEAGNRYDFGQDNTSYKVTTRKGKSTVQTPEGSTVTAQTESPIDAVNESRGENSTEKSEAELEHDTLAEEILYSQIENPATASIDGVDYEVVMSWASESKAESDPTYTKVAYVVTRPGIDDMEAIIGERDGWSAKDYANFASEHQNIWNDPSAEDVEVEERSTDGEENESGDSAGTGRSEEDIAPWESRTGEETGEDRAPWEEPDEQSSEAPDRVARGRNGRRRAAPLLNESDEQSYVLRDETKHRSPESEKEKSGSDIVSRISHGKVQAKIANLGGELSRELGLAYIGDGGKPVAVLPDNMPDGSIAFDCVSAHEGFHAEMFSRFGDDSDVMARGFYNGFRSENDSDVLRAIEQYVTHRYAMDYDGAEYEDLPHDIKAQIANEILAHLVSGTFIRKNATRGDVVDTLQEKAREYLVRNCGFAEDAFLKVPSASDFFTIQEDIRQHFNKFRTDTSKNRAKSNTEDDVPFTFGSEESEAEAEIKDNEERAKSTFGNGVEKVAASAKNFANIKTDLDSDEFRSSDKRAYRKAARRLDTFRSLFQAAADGSGNIDELLTFYTGMRNDDALSNFWNEDVQREIERYRSMTNRNFDSYNESASKYAATRLMQMMAHKFAKSNEYAATLRKMNESLRGSRNGVLRRIAKSDKLVASVTRALFRWQVNPETVFKMIDAFDKGNAGEGYKLAKELEQAHREKYKVMSKARSRFLEVSSMDGYEDFAFGKEKVKDYTGREWDARDALKAIKSIDTIRTTSGKKLGGTDGFGILRADGGIDYIEMRDIDAAKLRSSLWNGLSDVAKAYSQATDIAMADVKEPLRQKRMENDGVEVSMVGDSNDLMEKAGLEKAVYFPLEYVTDSGETFEWDITKQNNYSTLPRFMQERSENGKNYILIRPVTETVDSYFQQASNYLAYSSYNDKIRGLAQGSRYMPSIVTSLGNTFGKDMGNWYRSYIEDLQSYKNEDDVEGVNSLLRQGRQRLQQGALLFSVSVPMKQISSYWAASGILHPDSLIKAYRVKLLKPKNKSNVDVMLESRGMGNLEMSAAEAANEAKKLLGKMKHGSGFVKFMANAINQMDYNTVSNLYDACRYDVLKYQFNGDEKAVSTEAYASAVEEKFQEVVDRSQPNFDKQMRAEYGRTDNEVVRMLSMFRTQQTQNMNLLATALGEYNAAKGTEHSSEATRVLRETVAGQAASALSLSILTVLADMLLHRQKKYEDDEKEIDAEKILTRLGINAVEAASGTMWFGDSIAKWAIDKISGGKTKEFYGVNMGVISTTSDILENFENFLKNPTRSNARYCAGNIGTLLGVPLNNAYSMLNSFIMYAKDVAGTNKGDYDDILKYLDAEAKAAKKAEEKAAKSSKSDGAALLAETAKQNASESELNSTGETIDSVVSRNLTKPYKALTEAGMDDETSKRLLTFIDTDGNSNIKQAELIAFYKDNPDYEAYAEAMWNSYGWKTTWESAKKKAGK